MITVHHLNNSRSQRVLWLLEELSIPYKIKKYQRDPETMLAPPSLKAVHPLGKSPVISDGDRVIAESGAIVEYLIDKYDGEGRFGRKPGSAERVELSFWLHYAEGSFMPPLLIELILSKLDTAPVPFFMRPLIKVITGKVRSTFLNAQLKTHLGFVENALGQHRWLLGEQPSAADVQMSYPVEAALARAASREQYPNLARFVAQIHERPAYKAAEAKGGELAWEF